MSPALVVETEDFADAARSVSADVVQPMLSSTNRLVTRLLDSLAMAGSDTAGMRWAAAYDRAASEALAAAQDVVNGAMQLAAMFAQTARNYESADSASTPGARRAMTRAVHDLPGPGEATIPTVVPSAAGGSGSTPSGWGLVKHLVGYVWPDGHQDRLHATADAWRAAAEALAEPAALAESASLLASGDWLPESADMHAVCTAMRARIESLASAYRGLARACDDYAHHLDQVHHEVISELTSLVEWTAGIEVAGGLLSVVSLGASEAAAQATEAARIAISASRVGSMIEKFIASARAVVEAIPAVEQAATQIRLGLEGLLGGRLAIAGVTAARALPVTRAARMEMAAEDRLAAESSTRGLVPRAPRLGTGSRFRAPRIFRNRHGQLTNGKYVVSSDKMLPHVRGSLAGGKSQFFSTVDADQAVLDAAAYADKHALWDGAKAKVFVENGPIGVWSETGEPTHWINVYRTASGAVHGSPGGPG